MRSEEFDAVNFTRGGSFGDEDADFGYRLLSQGHRIIFNPDAISWQKYVVGPRHHLRQWRQAGRADVAFARKHPEQAAQIFALRGAGKRINRWLWHPLAAWPRLTAPLLAGFKELAVGLVERGCRDRMSAKLFFEIRSAEYWRGVHEAGGIPASRVLRVLAYHAIADLHGASILEPYGVPPDDFRDQLDLLQRYGFHFISADEFLRFVDGSAGLPRRALLLTFDDCFEDLTRVVLPMLQERAIPALAFAVSSRLGRTNEWDKPLGGLQIRLVDGSELAQLQEAGIEIGAHSRTHPFLPRLSEEQLMAEIEGSLADLEGRGLRRPRFFAYPHGESDRKVERAVEAAGFRAAFTVAPGLVRPGRDPYRLPRIEILRGDQGWKYLYKVFAARSPAPGSGRLRPLVGHLWRRAARALPRQLRRARP